MSWKCTIEKGCMLITELSIRAGAVAWVLLLGACGPATTMPSLKENVHARPALSHKCYRLLHLALPPTVKLIDNPVIRLLTQLESEHATGNIYSDAVVPAQYVLKPTCNPFRKYVHNFLNGHFGQIQPITDIWPKPISDILLALIFADIFSSSFTNTDNRNIWKSR